MQQLAIYDMDKTITRRPTWTPFLIHAAITCAPWRLVLLPVAGLATLGYALQLIERGRLKEITQALMLGRRSDPARIAAAAKSFARRLERHNIYPGAIAQIAADRAAGRRIVLATASCRFYVRAIAARLGIDDVVATESVIDDAGWIVARIAGDNCYGLAKLRMIEAWLAGQGIARDDVRVRFYSDHISDAPALEWADAAFAVCPHAPLRTMAEARGWTILDWDG